MDAQGMVFIVDDDPRVRESLGRLFDSVGQCFQSFATAREFLEAYDPAEPGCLVLDVRMPGMSGIELHRRMVAEELTIPVIIISGHGNVPMASDALRRGAIDFLEKPLNPQKLLDRVQEALAGDAERHGANSERDTVLARLDCLTSREREVVDFAVSGLTNKQIASRLGVSPQAIDVRRSKAMKKLQARNVPDLVRLMLQVSADKQDPPVVE